MTGGYAGQSATRPAGDDRDRQLSRRPTGHQALDESAASTGTSCAARRDRCRQAVQGRRWALLKNPADLTDQQAATLAALRARRKIPRAWAMKEIVRAIFAPGLTSRPSMP